MKNKFLLKIKEFASANKKVLGCAFLAFIFAGTSIGLLTNVLVKSAEKQDVKPADQKKVDKIISLIISNPAAKTSLELVQDKLRISDSALSSQENENEKLKAIIVENRLLAGTRFNVLRARAKTAFLNLQTENEQLKVEKYGTVSLRKLLKSLNFTLKKIPAAEFNTYYYNDFEIVLVFNYEKIAYISITPAFAGARPTRYFYKGGRTPEKDLQGLAALNYKVPADSLLWLREK